ncbi:hypothetical protein [Paenibacillus pinihumi]|uniref:hypothetical protein n=1 Tax=Paenibacillus pinihumi TaxID=669462 RepID=UPI00041075D7|nr:hypothetical protein [Paenibacillus pinihumi]
MEFDKRAGGEMNGSEETQWLPLKNNFPPLSFSITRNHSLTAIGRTFHFAA